MLYRFVVVVLAVLLSVACADDTFRLSMSRVTPLSTSATFTMRPDQFQPDIYSGAHYSLKIEGGALDASTYTGSTTIITHNDERVVRSVQEKYEGTFANNRFIRSIPVPGEDFVRDKYVGLSVQLNVKISNIKDVPGSYSFAYSDGRDITIDGDRDFIIYPALTASTHFAVAFDDMKKDGTAPFSFSTGALLEDVYDGITIALENYYTWHGESATCTANGLKWLTSVSEDKKTLSAKVTALKGQKIEVKCPDLRIYAAKDDVGYPLRYKVDSITKADVTPAIYDGVATKKGADSSPFVTVLAVLLVIGFFAGIIAGGVYLWKRYRRSKNPDDFLLGEDVQGSQPSYNRMG